MRTLETVGPNGLDNADRVQLAHTLFRMFIDYYFRSIITFIVFYFYSSLEMLFLRIFLLFEYIATI